VYPVGWESAAIVAGEIDLAALTRGGLMRLHGVGKMAPRVVYSALAEHTAHGTDAILLLTKWPEF
jgi:hypothetical protein